MLHHVVSEWVGEYRRSGREWNEYCWLESDCVEGGTCQDWVVMGGGCTALPRQCSTMVLIHISWLMFANGYSIRV